MPGSTGIRLSPPSSSRPGLGIGDLLRWRATSMGYFLGDKLHPWGDPLALLHLPGLDLVSKLRYGTLMLVSTRRERWDALEHISS